MSLTARHHDGARNGSKPSRHFKLLNRCNAVVTNSRHANSKDALDGGQGCSIVASVKFHDVLGESDLDAAAATRPNVRDRGCLSL